MPQRTGRPFQRLKRSIIRRDQGICHLCGQPGADSADHLLPASQGGTETRANLRAVHHTTWPHCNQIRGDRPIADAQADIAALLQRTTPSDADWSW